MPDKIKRIRITDKIEYVAPQGSNNNLSCSGMIIHSDHAKVLFDTNPGETATKELLVSEKPDFAIISHYHLDHSTWDSLVLEYSEAKLLIPSTETAYLTNHEYFIQKTAAPYGLGQVWRDYTRNIAKYKAINEFTPYDGSSDLNLHDMKMEFVVTTGHSPGHTSVYFPDRRILFTSDIGLSRLGPWYGWGDCDLVKYAESILVLKSLKPNLLLTSHEGIIRKNIEEAFDRSLKAFFLREEMIKKKLDDGFSKEEIVEQGIFYRNKTKAKEPMRTMLVMWDSIMFDHHLKKINEGGLCKDFPGLN